MGVVIVVGMDPPQLEVNMLFSGIWILCYTFECAISDMEYCNV